MENIAERGGDAAAITLPTVIGIGEVVTASYDAAGPVSTSRPFTVENGYFGYAPINPKN